MNAGDIHETSSNTTGPGAGGVSGSVNDSLSDSERRSEDSKGFSIAALVAEIPDRELDENFNRLNEGRSRWPTQYTDAELLAYKDNVAQDRKLLRESKVFDSSSDRARELRLRVLVLFLISTRPRYINEFLNGPYNPLKNR